MAKTAAAAARSHGSSAAGMIRPVVQADLWQQLAAADSSSSLYTAQELAAAAQAGLCSRAQQHKQQQQQKAGHKGGQNGHKDQHGVGVRLPYFAA